MSPHHATSTEAPGWTAGGLHGHTVTISAASPFHEEWRCGSCGRSFADATSCCAHEQQCGGHLTRW